LFTVVCSIGFVAATAVFLLNDNPWPLVLALPVLVFLLAYSFAKRFTALSHLWLGASLMLAPLAAWIAVKGMHDLVQPAIIALTVLLWVTGFDIIYACQDVEFDRRNRLHSIPAALGIPVALRLAQLCHALMIACLLALWNVSPHLRYVFLAGVFGVAVLLLVEHWLVRPGDVTRANLAFFYVNGIISTGLLLTVWVQVFLNRAFI
jgi:4-hydroxybenzoate polyprenyltransferase